ncbi:glutamate synthase large subunit [Deltaproteobacteria bacterium TL4]
MQRMYPPKQGLYDPAFEHDSCGVGFIVNVKGQKSHEIVAQSLQLLANLKHRGALGADPSTGDGAGILMQIPHDFFVEEALKIGFSLPSPGNYGVGVTFLPQDKQERQRCGSIIELSCGEEGLQIAGWRDVPIDLNHAGKEAKAKLPAIRQVFIKKPKPEMSQDDFERKLYVVRKLIYASLQGKSFSVSSMSCRTIVYKGMLHAPQLQHFYPDLKHPKVTSALAIVHSRFSTNTFPSWNLAQPFRFLAHNGEINTLRGNVNWMNARKLTIKSPLYDDISKLYPLIMPHGSDSACADNALEFLVLSGYSLAHAIMMLIPEAWQNDPLISPEKRAFYEYQEQFMEPWDGPAAMAYTDGVQIGATLDRNGLRPARYVVTKDDCVIMASEVGALEIKPENILKKGRLQPGKMFLIDTNLGQVINDETLKAEICKSRPYQEWLSQNMVHLDELPEPEQAHGVNLETLVMRQKIFGYTYEDLNLIIQPMVLNAQEAIGSMGNDTPLAILSRQPHVLYNYFRQVFAQVTNPAIDPIREELVMSLLSHLGKERNILEQTPEHAKLLQLGHPVITNEQLEKIRQLDREDFKSKTLPILFRKSAEENEMEKALELLCLNAEIAAKEGHTFLILSDRGVNEKWVPIPALLVIGALHNHLVQKGIRTLTSLILETGEPREIAHFAVLIGYGAGAINPYLAMESIEQMRMEGIFPAEITKEIAIEHYLKAIKKGLFKIFSKMGISTIQSYRGAQVFEVIGLSDDLVQQHFTGTPTKIGGIGIREIAKESLLRHQNAMNQSPDVENSLDLGGLYYWRRRGEFHQINPGMIQALQTATQKNSKEAYKEFADRLNNHDRNQGNIRSLLQFKTGQPIPLEEVEPASEIVKRFVTGAMSFGSISLEAHETLAIAMNRIGGKSNSGEGGENTDRFVPRPNGDSASSAIKQVASARFGVTINYLTHCADIQIKIAQGAKPGEGGQLPGLKVSKDIAKVRYATPGVQLISPPPHHDIYSIEDLAQLIFDLKNANPQARITVKLVAEAGVGTIAAGVAKAHADLIVISGCEGGTGAAPLTSIKHAGGPWELGLAETHQTLLINGLRGVVKIQTDGQIKTGRDVVIAAMLGAEECGFATVPLISMGCIMMRKCHLNTCPVGIATQNPELRKKFIGKPEYVINYFSFVAEEVREIMASLGFRKFEEMVGRVDMLKQRTENLHWKSQHLDLSKLLHEPEVSKSVPRHNVRPQNHGLEAQLDHQLIAQSQAALENKTPVSIELPISNTNRTVGTMLSGRIALKYGNEGLPENTIQCKFKGSAGQSFGAFLAAGVTLTLEGEANDYVGKGLSGGRLVIYPPKSSSFKAEENVLIGNTVLYGATGGEAFFYGLAGERFAVRNSGAVAVVEGIGDHGCEYMTGGRIVVLGPTGRNFAAGMSGGYAYVYNEAGTFERLCNKGLVEFEALTDATEIQWLKELLSKHQFLTGSSKAHALLNDWDRTLKHFVKVIPVEYRRALDELKAEELKQSA